MPERKWVLVNFSSEILRNHPGGSEAEILTVYAVVDSILANLKPYRRVWLLVDGRSRKVFKAHVYVGVPLPWNQTWIARRSPHEP